MTHPAQPPAQDVPVSDFAHGEEAGNARTPGWLENTAYVLGGLGLLGATFTDSIAVAGRHTGFHLLGSIELVQAAVVLLASSAILIATLIGGHAGVHIVTERMSKPVAHQFARIASAISGALFILLAIGSIQVAAEQWSGHEMTELLQLPIRWLRCVWIVFVSLSALAFLRFAVRGKL